MTDKQAASDDVKWSYHKDRQAAIDEVHARPALDIISPAIVLHIAFTCEKDILCKLFRAVSKESNPENQRHLIGKIDNIDIKIERHTEFESCTFIAGNTDNASELASIYRQLFAPHNIKILSKCKIALVPTAKQLAQQFPFGKRIYGGIMRGNMQVHSTLDIDDENNITYAIFSKDSGPNELGRRVQRLFELETYRIMALIGLPLARRISARLNELEADLNDVTSKLEAMTDANELLDKQCFQQLSSLSGKVDNLCSETRFRFSASNAYFAIVDDRMNTLTEEKHGDMQTISGFLRSRLDPARATIRSVERRQRILTEDISRALTLLRTRLEIEMAQGNQALLKSLDSRHRQQLLLSQAVEGLSSIAITYYAIGLLSYFLKGLDKAGKLPLSYNIVLAIAVPTILFATWYSIRRLRLKLHKDGD